MNPLETVPPPAPSERPQQGDKVILWTLISIVVAACIIWLNSPARTDKMSPFGERDTLPPGLAQALQESAARPASPPSPVIPRVSILWERGDYDHERKRGYFHGVVTNNTDETIRWLNVEYSLYDETDAKIGSTTDSIANLRGHETWRFRADIFKDNVKTYRFEGVSVR